jgi:hypothetical protein
MPRPLSIPNSLVMTATGWPLGQMAGRTADEPGLAFTIGHVVVDCCRWPRTSPIVAQQNGSRSRSFGPPAPVWSRCGHRADSVAAAGGRAPVLHRSGLGRLLGAGGSRGSAPPRAGSRAGTPDGIDQSMRSTERRRPIGRGAVGDPAGREGQHPDDREVDHLSHDSAAASPQPVPVATVRSGARAADR